MWPMKATSATLLTQLPLADDVWVEGRWSATVVTVPSRLILEILPVNPPVFRVRPAPALERRRRWNRSTSCRETKQSVAAIEQAFKHGGYKSVAEWRLNQQKASARRQYFSPYGLALETARAQHKDETLRLLEDAYREGSPRLVFLQSEPFFDFLHQEPRYQGPGREGRPATRSLSF